MATVEVWPLPVWSADSMSVYIWLTRIDPPPLLLHLRYVTSDLKYLNISCGL